MPFLHPSTYSCETKRDAEPQSSDAVDAAVDASKPQADKPYTEPWESVVAAASRQIVDGNTADINRAMRGSR